MGALRVGDRVLDEWGVPCNVVAATEVFLDHECYELRFSNGTVVAGEGHLWPVGLGYSANGLLTTKSLFHHAAAKFVIGPGTSLPSQLLGIRPVPNVPTRCIQVDSLNGLYLCGGPGWAVPTHNSDLMLGLALTQQLDSLILRREAVQVSGLVNRTKEILSGKGSWRAYGHGGTMKLAGRTITFAGCEQEEDKINFQGNPRDFYGFDELTAFSASQYRFIIGWNRTSNLKQRCRVIATGNPPTNPEGRWIVVEWAPWLDRRHHNPAEVGELRWYTYLDGKLAWLKNGDSFEHFNKQLGKIETVKPRSRTFIRALVTDNPIYMQTGYVSVLQAFDEPLRSQMLYGDFTAGTQDHEYQAIPTAWVLEAQKRWRDHVEKFGEVPPEGQGLSCLGVDPSHGGADSTAISARYGPWFARVKKWQGTDTDSGQKVAALTLKHWENLAPIHVDAIGYGASACDSLKEHEKASQYTFAINVSEPTQSYDRTRMYRLVNKRAMMYWRLREALDPRHGDDLMLPDDPELLADLTAPRFEARSSGYYIEPKADIKARIGRSPDMGDALALASIQRPPWECPSFAPAGGSGAGSPAARLTYGERAVPVATSGGGVTYGERNARENRGRRLYGGDGV